MCSVRTEGVCWTYSNVNLVSLVRIHLDGMYAAAAVSADCVSLKSQIVSVPKSMLLQPFVQRNSNLLAVAGHRLAETCLRMALRDLTCLNNKPSVCECVCVCLVWNLGGVF